jgi:hypothetical protein
MMSLFDGRKLRIKAGDSISKFSLRGSKAANLKSIENCLKNSKIKKDSEYFSDLSGDKEVLL